ncbi:hypothetical protein P7K49_033716 [Saguinus oedipus]|uniref:Uncharacterized protein n=1 Tax=Saguinus oedipus TaxID=9490 RepID=A0ABQ9TSQ1_SAGOE|nr:hypothetical protein P7K49_033716 [Saguinus oedipus]
MGFVIPRWGSGPVTCQAPRDPLAQLGLDLRAPPAPSGRAWAVTGPHAHVALSDLNKACGNAMDAHEAAQMHQNFSQQLLQDHIEACSLPEHNLITVRVWGAWGWDLGPAWPLFVFVQQTLTQPQELPVMGEMAAGTPNPSRGGRCFLGARWTGVWRTESWLGEQPKKGSIPASSLRTAHRASLTCPLLPTVDRRSTSRAVPSSEWTQHQPGQPPVRPGWGCPAPQGLRVSGFHPDGTQACPRGMLPS